MNQSKDHLGYVSTWFNSNMCEMQLFFSMAWLVLSYVLPKYGLERPKRRMRMLYSDGLCMGYVILDSVLQRPLWLKMEQVWMTLKMGSKNFKMNFQQNAIVALMASSWPTRGGWAPKAYSIVGWPGLWNRRGLVEQFLTDWSRKSFQHWDNWNTRSEERVIILHFTFIIINIIFHLSLITVWLKCIS